MSINNMTQAQKAQLRYVAIIEQSKNAMGDMARTIDSPANQLRILESRIQTLKRAIGDSLMPVLSAALPYVTAFVQILGEFFRDLANYLGFEVPEFDYSSLEKGNIEVAQSFDEATAASEKFKGSLSSIDQLNIIGSKKESGGGAGDDLLGGDLNLDLPSYDFLGDLTEETTEAYKRLKDILSEILPIIGGVATALGALWVADKVSSGVKALSDAFTFLTKSPMGKVAATIGAAVTSFLAFKNAVKDAVLKDNFTKLGIAIGGAATAIGIFIATGNPVAAVVTGIAAAVGSLVGYFEALDEQAHNEALEKINKAFERGETPISEYADQIERLASGLTEANDNFLSKQGELQAIADNATNVHDSIEDMITALGDLDGVDPSVVDNLLGAFKTLSEQAEQYIQSANNNFKLMVLASADMLEAQGISVANVVSMWDASTDRTLDKIEEYRATAEEITEKISAGTATDTDLQELQEANDALAILAGVDLSNLDDVKATLSSFGDIKLESPEKVADALDKINDVITNGYKAIDDSIKSAEDTLYRQKITGAITESAYKTQMGVLDEIRAAQEQQFASEVYPYYEKIKGAVDLFGSSAIDAEANRISDTISKNIFSGYAFRGAFGGEDYYDMAVEEVKKDLGDNADAILNYEEFFRAAFAEKGLPQETADAFLNAGKQIPQSVADGIDGNQDTVANSLSATFDNASEVMSAKFAELKKAAEEGGALLQRTLQTAFGKADNGGIISTAFGSISGASGGLLMGAVAPTVTNSGADAGELTRAGTAWNAEGAPVNVNVNAQTYVEMDGEQVGSTFYNYSERQMAYSNGR